MSNLIPSLSATPTNFAKSAEIGLKKVSQNQSLTRSVLNPRSREVWRQTAGEREFRASAGLSQCGGLRAKPVVIGRFCSLASRAENVGRGRAGGEGGIRTPGTVARTPHFECGAIDHSATSPWSRRQLARSMGRYVSNAARRNKSGGGTIEIAALIATCSGSGVAGSASGRNAAIAPVGPRAELRSAAAS